MEIIVIGIISSLLTKLAGKLKISKTYLSMGLCILLGAIYYFATKYYNIQREQLVQTISGVYASSQAFYSLRKKYWNLEEEDK